MRPLRSADEVFALLEQAATTAACKRAIKLRLGEILGVFNLPGGFPVLLVRVEGRYTQTWILGLVIDEPGRQYRFVFPREVQWQYWAGDTERKHPIWDGAYPNQYAKLKDEACHALENKVQ